jgi:hypothetical protein
MVTWTKLVAAGCSATLATLALSSGVLACEATVNHGGSSSSDERDCRASGDELIKDVVFSTGSGHFGSLSGHVASGDRVVASFTVPAHCSVEASLVSYQAPSSSYDARTASQQTVFDSQDRTFGAGNQSLSVAVPNCYFQVDFVRGPVIQHLGPAGSNNFYGAQGRLISSANGGSRSCAAGASSGTTTGKSGSGGSSGTTSNAGTPPARCEDTPQLSDVSYLLGGATTVSNLRGHVTAGETVKANFTVPANCSMQLSLAAYQAPLPYFTPESAPQQKLFDSQSDTFTAGVHSLQVTVPGCYFQVDFVHGPVLPTLGSTSETDYGDVLISADNGGRSSCSSTSGGGTTSTSPSTPTPSPSPTTSTGGNGSPNVSGSATQASGQGSGVQAAKSGSSTGSRTAGAVLGANTSTPNTGAGLAIGTALGLILSGLILVAISRIFRSH